MDHGAIVSHLTVRWFLYTVAASLAWQIPFYLTGGSLFSTQWMVLLAGVTASWALIEMRQQP